MSETSYHALRMSARIVLLLIVMLLAPADSHAQARAVSATDDLLNRITADINDLEYARALTRARDLSRSMDALTLAHRIRLHLVLAAAHFPDDRGNQRPDSATPHLVAAVRLAPDVRYGNDLRWRGLDSLLDRARTRTLAAVVRGPATQKAAGTFEPGRIEVVATRSVRVRIAVLEQGTGRVTQRDSAVGTRANLRLLAHDERQVLLAPGAYVLRMVAHDSAALEDSVVAHYNLTVEGTLPKLATVPELPASALLPETIAPPKRGLVAKGLVFSGLTFAIASMARGNDRLEDRFGTDSRAYLVGGAMAVSTGVFLARAKPRPIPANMAVNAERRAEHDRANAAAIEANRVYLASYAPTVRIAPEPR